MYVKKIDEEWYNSLVQLAGGVRLEFLTLDTNGSHELSYDSDKHDITSYNELCFILTRSEKVLFDFDNVRMSIGFEYDDSFYIILYDQKSEDHSLTEHTDFHMVNCINSNGDRMDVANFLCI